jgi:hypothetical protein
MADHQATANQVQNATADVAVIRGGAADNPLSRAVGRVLNRTTMGDSPAPADNPLSRAVERELKRRKEASGGDEG